MSEPGARRSHEVLAIGLVSMAHFFSHFYILVVPSLLPLIKADLGAESAFVLFGLIMTAYAGMSAAGQYPAGVVMDRYGARLFIIFGLIGISVCMFLMGFANSVAVLIVLAAVAGLCDSQFHPSDYTIMTARVRGPWRGKAYAIHTSAGFLGFARDADRGQLPGSELPLARDHAHSRYRRDDRRRGADYLCPLPQRPGVRGAPPPRPIPARPPANRSSSPRRFC